MNPYKCYIHSIHSLFPKNINNKNYVYQVNILHILGVFLIQLGPLLPPKYMPYYIIYISILLSTYALLNNNCFMTILSNYISKTNYNPLCVKLSSAQIIMVVLIMYCLTAIIYPKYALYTHISSM